ncbi:MAG: hypothetical protein KGH63_02680 [Candidatus Micrarchaeota archaeon]|nr:hypothetical protein [Candidatus Micrarchaeota archaeon]
MGSVITLEQSESVSSKSERAGKAWAAPQPLLEAPKCESEVLEGLSMVADETVIGSAAPALPLMRLPLPSPAQSPQLNTAQAMAWGELSALIWGDISDLEVSAQRLTLKLRLASLMAKRKSKKKA